MTRYISSSLVGLLCESTSQQDVMTYSRQIMGQHYYENNLYSTALLKVSSNALRFPEHNALKSTVSDVRWMFSHLSVLSLL